MAAQASPFILLFALQGFEEIHVPALKPKPFAKNEKLVKIKDLPSWMHPAFEGMESLNRIQSQVRHALSAHSILCLFKPARQKANLFCRHGCRRFEYHPIPSP